MAGLGLKGIANKDGGFAVRGTVRCGSFYGRTDGDLRWISPCTVDGGLWFVRAGKTANAGFAEYAVFRGGRLCAMREDLMGR